MNTENHELDWAAFCYAAGEMSPADATAFEARLAEEQAAREALARAVELTQAVSVAESLEPAVTLKQTWNWSRRLAWMAVGSAASLLVALLWSGAGMWLHGGPRVAGDQSQLAVAWSQTRQELADSESDLWFPKHLSSSDALNLGEMGPGELGGETRVDDGDSATPAWLTAAVESYPNEPPDPDSTPFDGERSDN